MIILHIYQNFRLALRLAVSSDYTTTNMKCAICRNGMTERGYATVVLEKDGTTLVFKNVPAQICDNCGEEYISSEVNKTLLTHARAESDKGIALKMLSFAAYSDQTKEPIEMAPYCKELAASPLINC